eukprot:scaffold147341_cov22-Tisochrysis_lutea.AAC.1
MWPAEAFRWGAAQATPQFLAAISLSAQLVQISSTSMPFNAQLVQISSASVPFYAQLVQTSSASVPFNAQLVQISSAIVSYRPSASGPRPSPNHPQAMTRHCMPVPLVVSGCADLGMLHHIAVQHVCGYDTKIHIFCVCWEGHGAYNSGCPAWRDAVLRAQDLKYLHWCIAMLCCAQESKYLHLCIAGLLCFASYVPPMLHAEPFAGISFQCCMAEPHPNAAC